MKYYSISGWHVNLINENLSWYDTPEGKKSIVTYQKFTKKYTEPYYRISSPVPDFHPFQDSEFKLLKRKKDILIYVNLDKSLLVSNEALNILYKHSVSPHAIFHKIKFSNKISSTKDYNFLFFHHDCSEHIDFKQSSFYSTYDRNINSPPLTIKKNSKTYPTEIKNEVEFLRKRDHLRKLSKPEYLHFEKMVITDVPKYDFFTLYRFGQRSFVVSEALLNAFKKNKIKGLSSVEYLWHEIVIFPKTDQL